MNHKNYNQIYQEYVQQGQQQAKIEGNESLEIEKEKIVAVRKNDDGNIIAIKTDQGRELDYVSALNEEKAGMLAHVDVFHKYGRDILRSEPDGIKENNLDQLPIF